MIHGCESLLRLEDVKVRVGLGTTSIYKLVGLGEFPKPVRIGPAVRWVSTEIDAWIQARIAERDMVTGMVKNPENQERAA